MNQTYNLAGGDVCLFHADCREALRALPSECVDSCITDPPYCIASITKRFGKADSAVAQHGKDGAFTRLSQKFIGVQWDDDIAFDPKTWTEVLRVLKPGAHLAAFAFPKRAHRMACAIEDAGFEIRESVAWLYGTGQVRRRENLKAGHEPICIARKPLSESTLDKNLARWGVGALLIDAARGEGNRWPANVVQTDAFDKPWFFNAKASKVDRVDRWYENVRVEWNSEQGLCQVVLLVDTEPLLPRVIAVSGSGTVNEWNMILFGNITLGLFQKDTTYTISTKTNLTTESKIWCYLTSLLTSESTADALLEMDNGSSLVESAEKCDQSIIITNNHPDGFFLGANHVASKTPLKISVSGRKEGHPAVKPVSLMTWLSKLITPPNGITLDPFAGSGTTGQAALQNGFKAILCEREAEYVVDICRRLSSPSGQPLVPTKEASHGTV